MLPMVKVKTFFSIIPRFANALGDVRYYSRYPPYFVEPVINKDELEEIVKSKDKIEIREIRVKAANHHVTCSVFFDPDVHLLSQRLMRDGNRILAKSIVDKTFEKIKKIQLEKYYASPEEKRDKIELDPKVIFHKALQNTTPILHTKIVKKSGTFYNIPTMVTPKRAKFLAMKFLIESAGQKDARERYFVTLAQEIIKASENRGSAVQKKVDIHKYCEENRSYAHYRWT